MIAGTESVVSASTETVITAGDLNEYITKLSGLGKAALNARIAKIKAKLRKLASVSKTGKYAAAGKPGPKNSRQLAFALRGCQNALKWHESALGKVGTATAAQEVATAGKQEKSLLGPGPVGIDSITFDKKIFDSWLNQQLRNHPASRGDKHSQRILDYLYKVTYDRDKCAEIRRLLIAAVSEPYKGGLEL
jgi:hypothetical protein